MKPYRLVLVVRSKHEENNSGDNPPEIAERTGDIGGQSTCLDGRRWWWRRHVAGSGIRAGSRSSTGTAARNGRSTIWAECARHLRPAIRTKCHIAPPGSKAMVLMSLCQNGWN